MAQLKTPEEYEDAAIAAEAAGAAAAAALEEALARYGLTCCEVWVERGHSDTCAATITAELERAGIGGIRTQAELEEAGALPAWLGDEAFHRSHRAALLRKDPAYYVPLLPGSLAADPDLPYVWPSRAEAS